MESGEEHNYFSSGFRLVASIIGGIDLGDASSLLRALICPTALPLSPRFQWNIDPVQALEA